MTPARRPPRGSWSMTDWPSGGVRPSKGMLTVPGLACFPGHLRTTPPRICGASRPGTGKLLVMVLSPLGAITGVPGSFRGELAEAGGLSHHSSPVIGDIRMTRESHE